MELVKVTSRRGFRDWLALTERIYTNTKFVPPIRQQVARLFRRSRSQARGLSCDFYAVIDKDGEVIARTTGHHYAGLDDRLGVPHQLFGFTEFIERYDVFCRLMDGLADIARRNDRYRLLGPVNLLPNQSGGVITSGFDQPGFLDAAFNPAYYPAFYEQYGFTARFPAATYLSGDLADPALDPDHVFVFDDRRVAAERLEIHCASRRKFRDQISLLHGMLNASFMQLPYYTAISLPDLMERVGELGYLLDEKILLYLTRAGEPVAFIVCMPDISPYIARIRGNMNIFHSLRLLASRKDYGGEAILIIKGTIPSAQGRGYMTLLSRELLRNLRASGYRRLRSTFVDLDNRASAAQFIEMRGRVLHDVTLFQKEIPA